MFKCPLLPPTLAAFSPPATCKVFPARSCHSPLIHEEQRGEAQLLGWAADVLGQRLALCLITFSSTSSSSERNVVSLTLWTGPQTNQKETPATAALRARCGLTRTADDLPLSHVKLTAGLAGRPLGHHAWIKGETEAPGLSPSAKRGSQVVPSPLSFHTLNKRVATVFPPKALSVYCVRHACCR